MNERDESEGVAVPVPRPTRRGRAVPQASRRGHALVVGLVGVGAAIAVLALDGLKDNAIYSKPVDQLLSERANFAGRPVRAEGNLVHDSLQKRDSPCEYRFILEKSGQSMPVRFAQCVVPDTFRDVPGMDVAVTVEGEISRDGTFEATSVLAKCPSKYEMEQRAGQGEKAPHLAIPPGSIGASR
jgi:cytochrome c-type biogenesis protein CcmE